MRCRIHFAPIQYIDIRVGQDQKNRGLCQRCLQKQLETGIISLKDGEDLMNQVQQRSDELVKIQTLYEGIFKEIQVLLDANKLKIFEILLQLYQKSVFVYEGYSECQQLADQLSKDIIFNENQLQIKPLLYQDPILQKNQTALTEILNILKPKLGKMEIEVDVVKYQIIQPLVYGRQTIQLHGHVGQVNEVAFFHDCTMAASGSEESFVNLWCLKKMEKVKTFKGLRGSVNCVAFSKCDTLLACGGCADDENKMNQIIIWDVRKLKQNSPLYKLIGHSSTIYHLKFGENFVVSSSVDGTIRLWRQEKQIACYQIEQSAMGLALSKDEKLIAGSWGSYNCLQHDNCIQHIGRNKKLIQWKIKGREWEGGMCFSNNSMLLFQSSWNNGSLKAWNCYSGKPKIIRKAKFISAFTCSVSSDSTILATADTTYDDYQGLIHLIDISTWKLTQDLTVFGGYAEEACNSYNYVNFSSDDQYIGTGSGDGSIRIFRREENNDFEENEDIISDGNND